MSEQRTPRPAKRARLTGAERSEFTRYVATAYQGGHTIHRVAADTGTSYGRVHATLVAAGVQRRPRGGWRGVPGAR